MKRVQMLYALLLVLASTVLYIVVCARPAIMDESDGANAEVAFRMVRTGDWVTPYLGGVRRLNKPPMVYWLIAASFTAFEISDFTARLPSGLAALGVIAISVLVARMASKRAGVYAGLILAASPGFFMFTRLIYGDIIITFFQALSLYAFLKAYTSSADTTQESTEEPAEDRTITRYMLSFWAGLGLAVMSKGLIGVIFPALTIAAFLIVMRDAAFLRRMRFGFGLLLLAIIILPWHIMVGLRNPGFFYNYIVNEHIMRAIGRHYPPDFIATPVPEFWLINIAGIFPWVFFLPGILRYWPKSIGSISRRDTALVLASLWAVAVMIFFSISERLEYYALPAYPAVAAMVGMILAKAEEEGNIRLLRKSSAPVLISSGLAAAAGAAVLAVLFNVHSAPPKLGEHNGLTFFSPVAGITLPSATALWPQIATVVLGITMICISAAITLHRRRLHPAFLITCTGMYIAFGGIQAALISYQPYLSTVSLDRRINRMWRTGDAIAIEGNLFKLSSVGYYTRKPVYRWRERADWEFGSRFGSSHRLFINDAEFARMWKSQRRVFIIIERSKIPTAKFLHNAAALETSGTRVLLTNEAGK